MGEITRISSSIPNLLPMRDRSPGIHVSEIIHYLCVQAGIFKTRDDEAEAAFVDTAYIQLGCALEDTIAARFEAHYPGRYVRPGEQSADGIFLTPDLKDTETPSLDEIKLTWMSSRHDPSSEKFWRYWLQVKAYCYVCRITTGRLHVVHIMGDWRENREPCYNLWEQRFTKAELVENWQMLLSHSRTKRFLDFREEKHAQRARIEERDKDRTTGLLEAAPAILAATDAEKRAILLARKREKLAKILRPR